MSWSSSPPLREPSRGVPRPALEWRVAGRAHAGSAEGPLRTVQGFEKSTSSSISISLLQIEKFGQAVAIPSNLTHEERLTGQRRRANARTLGDLQTFVAEHHAADDRRLANAIRALAMDAVESANSGHPGMPMGMADAATALFTRHLRFDAADPALARPGPLRPVGRAWIDADLRVALSHRVRAADAR